MAWQTPKTDWIGYSVDGEYFGDKFNASDYQRIKGNLEELKALADTMWPPITLNIPNVTAASFGYASYINALERSLDAFAAGTFDPGIPPRKTWQGNGYAPNAEDLNRIEKSCLDFYEILQAQKQALPRLAFTLGGVQF